jgi:V/A-type H+-transporting ATPase subunit I
MGLIVNTPERMRKVRVVTARDYSDQTMKVLHRAGVLHVEEAHELSPIDREAIERERRRTAGLLTEIEDVLAYLPESPSIPIQEDIEVFYTRPLEEIEEDTKRLCTKLRNMHREAEKLAQELADLRQFRRYLQSITERPDIRLTDLNFTGECLFSRVFALPDEVEEAIRSEVEDLVLETLVTLTENEAFVYVIGHVEDKATVEARVGEGGGKIISVPIEDKTPKEYLETADEQIKTLEGQHAKISEDIRRETRGRLEELVLLREALAAENDRLAALEKACEARYATLIEGWIPYSSLDSAVGELKQDIGPVFVDSRKPKKSEDPPTKMRNAKPLRPFEVIVNLFGIPKYGEWDPTPIIAYSFAFFFGIMLGDAVYAIVLILIARFGLRKFTEDPASEGFKLFQQLLYVSAGVALVTGILTGTYLGNFYQFFGIEDMALSQAIQSVYLDAMLFIGVSLVIGLIHVNTGHLLGLIHGIRQRQRYAIPSRGGLFVLEIAGIPWVMNFVGMDILPLPEDTYPILLYGILAGVALIIVGSLMQRGTFLGSIFWLFDITGIMGDVMSYARLAGVGLATYYLAYCFNLMSTLVSEMLPSGLLRLVAGSAIALVILSLGHVLNLVLSTITCFVHSLRLCFVEFLFKFYEGGGRHYSPLKLRKRNTIPVRARA